MGTQTPFFFIATIADDFVKTHPNVGIKIVSLTNVEYTQKLSLVFAANDPPDIFHSLGGGVLAEQAQAGYLRDITDWVNGDKWESKVNPAALELYSYGGRVYGFPHDLGAVGFWYNSDLLAKAGYREFPSDWDSFLRMCDALKKAGITPIALGIADRWPVMYYWVYLSMRLGGSDIYKEIYAGTRSFTDPAIVKAGKMMRDLFARGYFPQSSLGSDFTAQSREMGDGACATQLMGQWALAIQAQVAEKRDALSGAMRFAPFPSVTGGNGSALDAMGGGNGFAIGKNAPDEAVEFLEFFTRAKNLQRYFDVFPAIPTVAAVTVNATGLDMVKSYLQKIDKFCLYPDRLFPQEIGNALNETSSRILIGEITAEEGAAIMDKAWSAQRKK